MFEFEIILSTTLSTTHIVAMERKRENRDFNSMMFCNIQIPDTSLDMPIDYMYRAHRSSYDDKSSKPMLRSRTQTFADLSSRFSALPAMSSSTSYAHSTAVYRSKDSGRVTTAYAISVTAVNNRRHKLSLETVDRGVKNTHDTAVVRIVTIKKPYVVDKPLPLTPIQTPLPIVGENSQTEKRRGHVEASLKPRLRTSHGSKKPLAGIIEQAGELNVFDVDGKEIPFRTLYKSSSDSMAKGSRAKVMTIFIQPSFCCRVSRYIWSCSLPDLIELTR